MGLDTAFLRPIAHRGLHSAAKGIVENTGPAFEAAIAKGYGIECDLRPASGGLPIVFHDVMMDRLTTETGPVAALGPGDLAAVRHRGDAGAPILSFHALIELVRGRVPLLVEIKSEWGPPDLAFLGEIARLARSYPGPIGLMSFDPAVMAALKELAPGVPRGIVSGSYLYPDGRRWWADKIDAGRSRQLAALLCSGPAEPSFFAYQVKALPTPETELQRRVMGLPLLTWTVSTPEERAIAAAWADAPIFEGFEP